MKKEKTVIQEHTPIERKLKTDIKNKNTLRNQLQKRLFELKKWHLLLKKSKNNRKIKKYINNIKRYMQDIKVLKALVKNMITGLEQRMKDEMKYSETEMSKLESMLKKEYNEMKEAQKVLIKAEQGKLDDKAIMDYLNISIEEYDDKTKKKDLKKETLLFSRELFIGKAKSRLKAETKDVKKVEKEIKSEQSDKVLFDTELKRLMLEKEILQ